MFGKKSVFKALKQSTSPKKCKCGYKVRGKGHEQGEQHKKTKPQVFTYQRGEKYPTNIGDLAHGVKETKRR